MNRSLAILAHVAFLLACPIGEAGARERFVVAGWYGMSFPQNGQRFRWCAVSRIQRDGTAAFFYLMRDGRFFVTIKNREFKYRKGQDIDARYRIDRRYAANVRAVAVLSNAVQIEMPVAATAFRMLQKGNELIVRLTYGDYSVNLAGTAAALERMRQCVWNRLDVEAGRPPRYLARRRSAPSRPAGTASAGTRKFAASAGSSATKGATRGAIGGAAAKDSKARNARAGDTASASVRGGASEAARRLEAVTYVANVLAKAGFRDYRILQQKEMRRRAGSDFDVVWRTGVSVGALRIYSGRQAREFEDLATRVIIQGTKACKAGFRSGVKREVNSPVLRFFTQCDGEKGWHALYALVRGKAGRVYLLLSLGNGLSEKVDGADLRAVDARMVKAMTARQLD